MTFILTFDPREIDAFVAKLDPRRELVYRVALRGLVTAAAAIENSSSGLRS